MDFTGFGIGGFTIFAVLAFLFNISITILWFVIGWRAMRAHEKLADYIEFMVRRQLEQRETQSHVSTDD
ncbi:hypothetical protein F4083_03040 [Candidatus Poribacteria bacterium]|nr:hypothetical protein [Candidatus Poribacteria bacterium]MYI93288.1 hypothetical protein [Candidatus Poribacteria bacterium]